MGSKNNISITFALALASMTLSGCAVVNMRNAPPNGLVAAQAVIPGIPAARFWGDKIPQNVIAGIRAAMPHAGPPAYHVSPRTGRLTVDLLALSGGGGDGAFGAGLLAGWSARGSRPKFEIVTGVSAGAIIAPLAFLGPRYDRKLKKIWTKYSADDLVTTNYVAGLLGGTALADTTPLANLIAKYVTRNFLREIAAAYRKGRLLLIGTTNLDAQRPVIWNMGEIAVSSSPHALALFRKVILASAAVPAAFPPVRIRVGDGNGNYFDELHVDGGVTKQVFIGPPQLDLRALDGLYPSPPLRRVFIVKNGKLVPEFTPVQPNTIKISTRSIETLIKYQNKGDIYQIYRKARDAGAEFHLTAVPANFAVKNQHVWDTTYQAALYKTGFAMGRSGKAWTNRPTTLPRQANSRPQG